MRLEGKARKAGDNVDTDQMYPSRYTSTSEPEEMAINWAVSIKILTAHIKR